MVPYQNIDVNAPFSAAFLDHGMAWASKIVSLGAVLGEGEAPGLGIAGRGWAWLVMVVFMGVSHMCPSCKSAGSKGDMIEHYLCACHPPPCRHRHLLHDGPAGSEPAVCGARPRAPAARPPGGRQPTHRRAHWGMGLGLFETMPFVGLA